MEAVDEQLVDREDRLILLFTPPFDHGHAASRATSRATCRASARTAASTPTPRPGSSRRSPLLGRGRPRRRAVRPAQPDPARRRPARRSSATRSSPTSSRPTSTAGRRTSAAAAGPGTPARPPGSTASASSDPRLPPARRPAGHRPVHPGGLAAASRSPTAIGSATYRIAVENPGRRAGSRRSRSTARIVEGGAIPLADDGQAHEVRVEIP